MGNPIEFINSNRADKEEWYSLKNSIIDFIGVIINPVFSHDNSLSNAYDILRFWVTNIQNIFDNLEVSYKVKDGLLVMLGALSPQLVASEYYYTDLNNLFSILWDFNDGCMDNLERNILAYRILNLFEEYSMMDWERPTVKKIARYILW